MDRAIAPAGAGRRRALRQRDQRRRVGPPLRRGPGCGRAVPLRGVLAAGDRGDVLRRRRRGHDRAAPCPRWSVPTARPGCWCRPTIPVRWPAPSRGCSTTRSCGPGSGAAGRERVVSRFTWQVTAAGTAACYQAMLEGRPLPGAPGRRRERLIGSRGGLMLTVDYDRLGVGPGDLVLDLGCGFGRHAFEAARRGASVVALDAGPEEVAQVRATFGAMVEAGELDAHDHAPPPCRATRCACRSPTGRSIASLPRRCSSTFRTTSAAMRELARVLKPGGAMAVTVPRCAPEAVNWVLSDEYHDTPGGHVRIYRRSTLERRSALYRARADGVSPCARAALSVLVASLPGRVRATRPIRR